MPIIEVEHLTKTFQLGQLESLRTTLLNLTRRFFGKPVEVRQEFRAVDDVSFKIEAGEVVGIIGHNGAGKSTLLKLISRITSPTSGRITATGRIAPLIEVGAGFVPDLTGRENVYLNGSILGLARKDIDRKFDEIVAFSEMAQFIDTPVKRYSSGMKVKLAFAVATSIESEILIVDEVLAVGDLAFQRKCFDRMEDLIRRQGRTVLLVSHNLRHVERLCSRVLMFDHGQLVADGAPRDVCNAFYEKSDRRIAEQKRSESISSAVIRSSGEVELQDVKLLDEQGRSVESLEFREAVTIRLTYYFRHQCSKPVFVVGVHTTDFIYAATARSIGRLECGRVGPGLVTIDCNIEQFPLLPGVYALRADVIVGELYSTAFRADNLHPFRVVQEHANRAELDSEGFVPLEANWSIEGDQTGPDVGSDTKGLVIQP